MLLLMLLLSISIAMAAPVAQKQYAVIFDAGSTGTRMHIFSWTETVSVGGMPDVVQEANMKARAAPPFFSARVVALCCSQCRA